MSTLWSCSSHSRCLFCPPLFFSWSVLAGSVLSVLTPCGCFPVLLMLLCLFPPAFCGLHYPFFRYRLDALVPTFSPFVNIRSWGCKCLSKNYFGCFLKVSICSIFVPDDRILFNFHCGFCFDSWLLQGYFWIYKRIWVFWLMSLFLFGLLALLSEHILFLISDLWDLLKLVTGSDI